MSVQSVVASLNLDESRTFRATVGKFVMAEKEIAVVATVF